MARVSLFRGFGASLVSVTFASFHVTVSPQTPCSSLGLQPGFLSLGSLLITSQDSALCDPGSCLSPAPCCGGVAGPGMACRGAAGGFQCMVPSFTPSSPLSILAAVLRGCPLACPGQTQPSGRCQAAWCGEQWLDFIFLFFVVLRLEPGPRACFASP